MKDRVRQALFNLLANDVHGKHAIDLFAGTGALGLEALSRGAVRATFFERHHATADLVRRNAERLGESPHVQVLAVDTLASVLRGHGLPERRPDSADWLVFLSPPYDFYVDRREEMIALIRLLAESAPKASVLVVESDARFDIHALDSLGEWDIREYPPARIGILRLARRASRE